MAVASQTFLTQLSSMILIRCWFSDTVVFLKKIRPSRLASWKDLGFSRQVAKASRTRIASLGLEARAQNGLEVSLSSPILAAPPLSYHKRSSSPFLNSGASVDEFTWAVEPEGKVKDDVLIA